MKSVKGHKKLGQNTAEYMLLLLLIGGGSIVAFKVFGSGIISRFANVTNIITGQELDTTKVNTKADTNIDFKTFDKAGAPGTGGN